MNGRKSVWCVGKVGLLAILLIGAFGCMPPKNKEEILRDARFAYSEAQDYKPTPRYAPVTLAEAEKTLQQAESAMSENKMRHLAYLAQRRAQLAETIARREQAQAEQEALLRRQADLLRELRSLESEQARKRIEEERIQAQQEIAAEQARLEQLRKEAEEVRREAEMTRQELEEEQARRLAREQEAEEARQRLERLQSELQELEARQTERGLVLTLGDILFETNKAELVSGSGEKLDKVVTVLEEFPEKTVIVEGHTDSRGTFEYNQQLSEARAEAVRSALVARGISPEKIEARGLSESRPLASNETAIGRQQNRRVEIIIPDETPADQNEAPAEQSEQL